MISFIPSGCNCQHAYAPGDVIVTDHIAYPGMKYVPFAEDFVARVNEVLGRWIGLKKVRFVGHLPTNVSYKVIRKRLLVS